MLCAHWRIVSRRSSAQSAQGNNNNALTIFNAYSCVYTHYGPWVLVVLYQIYTHNTSYYVFARRNRMRLLIKIKLLDFDKTQCAAQYRG